jgi:hypothetical protein
MNAILSLLRVVVADSSAEGYGGTIAIVALVVMAIGHVAAYGREDVRRDTLSRLAQRLGFSFSPAATAELNDFTGTLELYSIDWRANHRNVLTLRREDFGLAIFDVQVMRGRRALWLKHTVSSLCVAGAEFPRAIVTKAKVSLPLPTLRSPDDVEYPDDPSFSSDYLLRGKDVLKAITPELIVSLRKHDVSFEAGGDWLRIYRVNQPVPPDQYVSFIEATFELAKLLQPKLTSDFPKFDAALAAPAVSEDRETANADPY